MLLALEETETALVTYRQRQERLVKLTDEVRESARAADIARARYREGVTDFLSLLDAERTQLQAEDSAAQAEAEVFTALVGLTGRSGGCSRSQRSRSEVRLGSGVKRRGKFGGKDTGSPALTREVRSERHLKYGVKSTGIPALAREVRGERRLKSGAGARSPRDGFSVVD